MRNTARSVSAWTFPRACATVRFLCGARARVNTQTRNRVITKACSSIVRVEFKLTGLLVMRAHRPLPAGQQLSSFIAFHTEQFMISPPNMLT